MSPGGRRLGAVAASVMVLVSIQACASPQARCGLSACGTEREALLDVTAAQLSVPAAEIALFDIRRYPPATIAWRVRQGGKTYQCREARDPVDVSRIQFVYCRPAT